VQKLLVVFGATGWFSGKLCASDPEISKQYRIRRITRDVAKPAAKELEAKGIEVVAADFDVSLQPYKEPTLQFS
jgi:uncharacterized protein YbjT (DUF2867 family)